MRVANPQKDNYAKSPTVRPPRWKVISVANDYKEYDAWIEENGLEPNWPQKYLMPYFQSASKYRDVYVEFRLPSLRPWLTSQTWDAADFEHPNLSVSQKTARWYAWSASTKVETMLQSFLKLKSHFCPPHQVRPKVFSIPIILSGNCDAPQEPNQR